MALKYLIEPVIGAGQIVSSVTPLATAVAPGTIGWDSTIGNAGALVVGDGTSFTAVTPTRLIAEQGIPLIVPSSGTFTAAGALSALTALPTTFAACYMFFPANAIATVSAAGMYFVQMSSTTAGTAFQNTYTSGVPTIPSTLIPCTTASSYTQTTAAALQVFSVTIPANSMGTSGKVKFDGVLTCNSTAGTKVSVLAFGGTTVFTTSTSTNLTTILFKRITNMGVTNAQSTDGGTGNVGSGAAAAAAPAILAIDTTAAVALTLSYNLNTATDFAILLSSTTEVIFQ